MRAPALAMLLFGAQAMAQHGPRLGIGLATQGPGVFAGSTASMLPGPFGGWHFELPLHEQVSLVPELLYATKGNFTRNPQQGASSALRMRYLELPLLIKVSTDKKPDGMFLLGGGGFGWFLAGRERRWLNGNLAYDEPFRLGDNQRRAQFSITVGMGMEGRRWSLDVRGMSSFSPFNPLVQVQNQVYALSVAYRFGNPPPEEPAPGDADQ
ncbi:MAG: outer membrane beta-barrel protein [Flavobacteriales bacterium]